MFTPLVLSGCTSQALDLFHAIGWHGPQSINTLRSQRVPLYIFLIVDVLFFSLVFHCSTFPHQRQLPFFLSHVFPSGMHFRATLGLTSLFETIGVLALSRYCWRHAAFRRHFRSVSRSRTDVSLLAIPGDFSQLRSLISKPDRKHTIVCSCRYCELRAKSRKNRISTRLFDDPRAMAREVGMWEIQPYSITHVGLDPLYSRQARG